MTTNISPGQDGTGFYRIGVSPGLEVLFAPQLPKEYYGDIPSKFSSFYLPCGSAYYRILQSHDVCGQDTPHLHAHTIQFFDGDLSLIGEVPLLHPLPTDSLDEAIKRCLAAELHTSS